LCFVADLQLLQNIMSVSFCQQLFLFFNSYLPPQQAFLRGGVL